MFGFGKNGCDKTCQERRAAHKWCKAQAACKAELRANTKEKFRRRSAQVILTATLTGQSYYYKNGRAHLGTNKQPSGAYIFNLALTGPNQSSGNRATIQIGYTRAAFHGLHGQFHAFIIAWSPSGKSRITRAGPGGALVLLTAEGGPWSNALPFDRPSDTVRRQWVGKVNMTFSQVVAHMKFYQDRINDRKLPYAPQGPNSNSYAFSFLEFLGFKRPTPIRPAIGWRFKL